MKTFFGRVFGLMKAYPLSLCVLCLVIIAQLAFKVGAAFCYQLIFDKGIRDHDIDALYTALGLLVLLLATFAVSALVQQRVMSRIGSAIGARIRQQLFDKILSLRPDHHSKHSPSSFVDLMGGDVDSVMMAVVRAVASMILDFLIIAASIVALFAIEWRLAVVVLAAVPFTMMAARPFQRRAASMAKSGSDIHTRILEQTQDAAIGHVPLLIFHAQQRMSGYFAATIRDLGRINSLYHFNTGAAGTAAQVAAGITQLVVIGFGGWLAYRGAMTGGLLVAFIGLLINISDAVGRIAAASPILVRGAESLGRIDQRLALPEHDMGGSKRIGGLQKDIRFDHISFAYSDGPMILDDVSFTVPCNSSVALVGPSGSGKSTALSLLMRLRQPTSGRILIDGEPLSEISEASFRAVTTAVPQMPLLFRGTLRENIDIARPGASDDEIESAARAAAIHETIAAMPEGYDSSVGEGGGSLSGGQRQRVALARAFLRDARILLLDEATSALDAKSQRAVNRSLVALHGKTTVLEVTHRLVDLEQFDQILVFDKGKLAQSGSHAQLIAEGGLYADLYARQHGLADDAGDEARSISPQGLKQFSFFANCSDATLQKLAGSFLPEHSPEGRLVFQEGDPGERFYIIVRGTVDILKNTAGSAPRRLARLHDGDFFGEMALVAGMPRSADVRTVTDSVFITLHRASFLALLDAEPQIKTGILEAIKQRNGN